MVRDDTEHPTRIFKFKKAKTGSGDCENRLDIELEGDKESAMIRKAYSLREFWHPSEYRQSIKSSDIMA